MAVESERSPGWVTFPGAAAPGAGGPGPERRPGWTRVLGELEARVHADGVAQLLAEHALPAVVGQLEQVEAGGGCGQAAARLPLADGEEAAEDATQGVPGVLQAQTTALGGSPWCGSLGSCQSRRPGRGSSWPPGAGEGGWAVSRHAVARGQPPHTPDWPRAERAEAAGAARPCTWTWGQALGDGPPASTSSISQGQKTTETLEGQKHV